MAVPEKYLIDWKAGFDETHGAYLPHLHQNEKWQFVTFRLADSLAQEHIEELKLKKSNFVSKYPQPWSRDTQLLYQRTIGRKCEELLDAGYGKCALRRADIRKLVIESLMRNDKISYSVAGFVIMPNHIHVLILPYGNETTESIIGGVKSYTALRANKVLGVKGAFWHRDMFDRIIRTSAHFHYCIDYMLQNPRNLSPNDYTLYIAR